jgi:hypothetical protein
MNREIDVFVEKLKSTVAFFSGLETAESDSEATDDFVPFV